MLASMANEAGTTEQLLVRKHRVHYEVFPALEIVDDARRQVGLDLRLWGMHPSGAGPLPGCSLCRQLRAEILVIVRAVLPPRSAVELELRPFDPALYDAPRFRTDAVYVSVRASPRPGAGPEALETWLKVARERLRALGVPEGSWHPAWH